MSSIDDFLSSKPYAANTKDRYERILLELIKLDNLETISPGDLLKFIERDGWGSSQRYLFLCACRQYIIWRFGTAHPALTARVKRRRSKQQRTLSPEKALMILAQFNTANKKGRRDLAICVLALDTGLRLAELCRLKLKDVNLQELVLSTIIKGGEYGTAQFSELSADLLRDYIPDRLYKTPELFQNSRNGAALTREGLQSIIKSWGTKSGIKLSPHDLRRTFATLATRFGAPTRIVQIAGRWSNIEMVALYTRALEQESIRPFLPVPNLLKISQKS